jgi:16S rRNA (cytosine967-C5)-methyltransferase
MVKPGGKMVYATCSILPSENEHQIDAFLDTKEGKSFTLEDKKTLLPSDFGYDGFFMARLVRNFS